MENTVLVIGGSGYIGLKLVKKLVELDMDVTVMSNNIFEFKSIDFLHKTKLCQGDITKLFDIQNIVKGKKCIINLAAVISKPGENINDPLNDLRINCVGQLNVLESIRKKNPKVKYIFVGSREQFGRVPIINLPVNENYPKNPISLYGIHKQTAEEYCHLYKRLYDLNSIIIRPVGVYGPGIPKGPERSVINTFIKKALRGEIFEIFGTGSEIKDFLHIDDLVNLFRVLINSDLNYDTFNIGCGKGLSFYEIGKLIEKYCEKGSFKLTDFPAEYKNFEMGSFVADITKVRNKTKWSPKFQLPDGIKCTAKYYSQNI